ncbi:MAG TPA: sensor histidine kinase [Candidatus Limnocylindria bacterium]|nr:sensor histidine kinase [Candidatus Limnocylindria bacterium]
MSSAQPPNLSASSDTLANLTREIGTGRDRPFDLSLAALLLALTAFTVAVVANPAIAPATFDPRLDVVVTTTATLVTAAATLLAWGRFREGRNAASLFRGSAFAVLFVFNALVLTVTLLGLDAAFGAELDRPGQLPLWSGMISRLTAACLLVLAGITGLRGTRRLPRRALLVFALPGVLILGAYVVAAAVQPALPVLLGPQGLAQLRARPDQPLTGADVSPFLVLGQSVIGIGFLVAGYLAYRVYQRELRGADACLAVGLLLAAFGQLHSIIHPGSYSGTVTTGDALRMGFYASLLVAVVVESWTDIRALRLASATIRRLNEAELAHATYAERARLAREIHDGLAQDLWYAKLKQGRLLTLPPGAPEVAGLASEVADALDAALADARQAVMALRPSDGGRFGEVLKRYVEDFGDRFGILADCAVEPMPTEPSTRAQAELLRIVQEALNNVRKHADATVVHVTAGWSGDRVDISITDNGCGFDPASVGDRGYGLRSMEERARIAGATLTIDSRPSDGTRVLVSVPVVAR